MTIKNIPPQLITIQHLREHIDDMMEDSQRYASKKLSFQHQVVYFAGVIDAAIITARFTTKIDSDKLDELKRQLVKDYIG